MADEFGPAARWASRAGIGVNFMQVIVGYQRDGMRGATYAGIDAGVTNGLGRLGPWGVVGAVAYNANNGSQGLVEENNLAGQVQMMNDLTTACMYHR